MQLSGDQQQDRHRGLRQRGDPDPSGRCCAEAQRNGPRLHGIGGADEGRCLGGAPNVQEKKSSVRVAPAKSSSPAISASSAEARNASCQASARAIAATLCGTSRIPGVPARPGVPGSAGPAGHSGAESGACSGGRAGRAGPGAAQAPGRDRAARASGSRPAKRSAPEGKKRSALRRPAAAPPGPRPGPRRPGPGSGAAAAGPRAGLGGSAPPRRRGGSCGSGPFRRDPMTPCRSDPRPLRSHCDERDAGSRHPARPLAGRLGCVLMRLRLPFMIGQRLASVVREHRLTPIAY